MGSKAIEFNILNTEYNITKETVLVLMSTYNRTEPIIKSVESIINQNYSNVLLHIVDDNSTENVIGLLTDYITKNEINNVIISKKHTNTGPYVNFNHILKYHLNDNFGYWVLQGSDDVSDPKRISTLVECLNNNSNLNACRSKYVREDEVLVPKYGDSMLIYKKNVLLELGYYDNNRFGADSDYHNRIVLKYGKIAHTPQTLYYAEADDTRLTKKHNNKDREQYVQKIKLDYKKSLYRKFIDVSRDSVVFGVATILDRKDSLKKTIDSIINQIDKLIVYQNGYYELFDFLQHPKIEVISSLHTGIDMGDAGKFYRLLEYDNCYYFSIDDDLIYPQSYVEDTLKRYNELGGDNVVTYHGRTFDSFPIQSYYNSKCERYACLQTVVNDRQIQFGGTGVMCFHTSLLKIPFKYFKNPNMADIWVGKYCIENGIKIICLKHEKGYINYIKQSTTIYDEESKNDKVQTDVVNSIDFNIKVEEIFIIEPITIQTEYPTIEIVKPELTKKQINYDKINSIFQNNNPKVILQQQPKQETGNLRLNSETFSKIQRPKKRLR